jgi:uncharacterized phosphosugar-binding protein
VRESGYMAGPVSTLSGALLLNLLHLEIIDCLERQGAILPLLRSQNTEGGMAHNIELGEAYRPRLSRPI